jgi:hypothetical protein
LELPYLKTLEHGNPQSEVCFLIKNGETRTRGYCETLFDKEVPASKPLVRPWISRNGIIENATIDVLFLTVRQSGHMKIAAGENAGSKENKFINRTELDVEVVETTGKCLRD